MGIIKWIFSIRKRLGWTGYSVESEKNELRQKTLSESRDLQDSHPTLRDKVRLMQQDAKKYYSCDLIVTSVYRSQGCQNKLYRKGRRNIAGEKIVTNLDGFIKKSRHNEYPSTAVDFAVDDDPGLGVKITWEEEKYQVVGILAHKHGLEWGGDWVDFKDFPHVQLPRESA